MQNSDVEAELWEQWVPEEYLNEYYIDVEPDEQFLLEFLVDTMRLLPEIPLVLDYGSGPTVHRLFPLVPALGEIHVAEYLDGNREAIQKWLSHAPDAHDWQPFSRETLRLESGKAPDPKATAQREEETRARITENFPTDARNSDPLGPNKRGFYPFVTTHYTAESVTRDKETWRIYLGNIASLVMPGGHFIVSSIGDGTFYQVGPHQFPSADLTEEDIVGFLRDHDFTLQNVRTRRVPDRAKQGYGSVIFAHAIKNK